MLKLHDLTMIWYESYSTYRQSLILWLKRFKTEQNIRRVPYGLPHVSLVWKNYIWCHYDGTKHKLSITACKKSNPHGNYYFGKKVTHHQNHINGNCIRTWRNVFIVTTKTQQFYRGYALHFLIHDHLIILISLIKLESNLDRSVKL